MNPQDREQPPVGPDGRPLAEQPAWRRDFPIDWQEDHYVSRRDFTKYLVLTSLAFVVGQVWIAVENWLRRRRGQLPLVPIASLKPVPTKSALPHIPVGGTLVFHYPDAHDACLLLRPRADGPPVAFDQNCTHLSCAVVPDAEHGRLRCPCHHGYFDLLTGKPLAGPPRRPLLRITLHIQDDIVYAGGVERTTA